MKRFIPPSTTQEEIFCKQILSLAQRSEKTGRPAFTAFLDERQQLLAEAQLAGEKEAQHLFFGGCEAAERKVLCVYQGEPPEAWDWPISVVRLRWHTGGDALTHRDYLGALMGLGLERRCIGDVLLCEDGAFVLLADPHAKTICDGLLAVGRVSITATLCDALPEDLPRCEPQKLTINVASLRLDAVLAGALKTGRGQTAELIRSGRVQVSHLDVNSPSFSVEEGESIVVRGIGKFRLERIGGESKKGRIFLDMIQY